MPYSFFTDRDLPDRLAERLHEWSNSPPRSQFQQYGPLNMFLARKFNAESFIIKPQARFREIFPISEGFDREDVQAVIIGQVDETMDMGGLQEVRERMGLGHRTTLSTDSYGVPVLEATTKKRYPDFAVTAYRDLIPRDGQEERVGEGPDAVRLIVEVSSMLGRESLSPVQMDDLSLQLQRYLRIMGKEGERWQNYAAGIAIAGNDFFAIEPDLFGDFDVINATPWFDLNSDQFIAIINRARDLNTQL